MSPPANLDDTAAFMAAARALAQKNQGNASSFVKEAPGSENGDSKSPHRPLSPTAPEFVPSSASSSAAGHHGDNQGTFSPSIKGIGQNVRTPSPTVFNPTVEEFIPSSAASSVGGDPVVKEERTTLSHNIQDAGPKGPGSKHHLANVDDTAKFMAAIRALRSRDISPAVNDHVASSNLEESSEAPGQADDGSDVMATDGMEQDQQSPAKDSFTSSTKAEKASSGNDTARLDAALGSEDSGLPVDESSSIDEPAAVTPVKKLADVDDTVGFMAAARQLRRTPGTPAFSSDTPGKLNDNTGSMTTTKDASVSVFTQPVAGVGDAGGFMTAAQALNNAQASRLSMSPGDHFVSAVTSPEKAMDSMKLKAGVSAIDNDSSARMAASQQTESPQEKKKPGVDDTTGFLAAVRALKERRASVSSAVPQEKKYPDDYGQPKNRTAQAPHIPSVTAVEDEDRENLITFKSWGTPASRDKPASQVRRIVLNGLPSTWATPTKVLSLIHGGAIEKVNVSPSGNAHIYFCDHEACKDFYGKYPNGIGLGPNKVYVDIGQEVDVVSSQLVVNRSVGATRVVRAVGVDLDITMAQLLQLATSNNRKVEKIVDNYAPDEARIVHFRFCSIDDAVRFRSILVRDIDWESCNIQYGKDPCELATCFHTD